MDDACKADVYAARKPDEGAPLKGANSASTKDARHRRLCPTTALLQAGHGAADAILDKVKTTGMPATDRVNKGLTLKMGQTHVQAYTKPLLEKIKAGEIDPSFVVTHPAALEDAPTMYQKFRDKKDGVIKVMLPPRRLIWLEDSKALGWPRDKVGQN